MNVIYKLDENLDCGKICNDIQKLINKKMTEGPLNNSVLSIGISTIIDSQEKVQTLYLSYKETNHDAGQNNS